MKINCPVEPKYFFKKLMCSVFAYVLIFFIPQLAEAFPVDQEAILIAQKYRTFGGIQPSASGIGLDTSKQEFCATSDLARINEIYPMLGNSTKGKISDVFAFENGTVNFKYGYKLYKYTVSSEHFIVNAYSTYSSTIGLRKGTMFLLNWFEELRIKAISMGWEDPVKLVSEKYPEIPQSAKKYEIGIKPFDDIRSDTLAYTTYGCYSGPINGHKESKLWQYDPSLCQTNCFDNTEKLGLKKCISHIGIIYPIDIPDSATNQQIKEYFAKSNLLLAVSHEFFHAIHFSGYAISSAFNSIGAAFIESSAEYFAFKHMGKCLICENTTSLSYPYRTYSPINIPFSQFHKDPNRMQYRQVRYFHQIEKDFGSDGILNLFNEHLNSPTIPNADTDLEEGFPSNSWLGTLNRLYEEFTNGEKNILDFIADTHKSVLNQEFSFALKSEPFLFDVDIVSLPFSYKTGHFEETLETQNASRGNIYNHILDAKTFNNSISLIRINGNLLKWPTSTQGGDMSLQFFSTGAFGNSVPPLRPFSAIVLSKGTDGSYVEIGRSYYFQRRQNLEVVVPKTKASSEIVIILVSAPGSGSVYVVGDVQYNTQNVNKTIYLEPGYNFISLNDLPAPSNLSSQLQSGQKLFLPASNETFLISDFDIKPEVDIQFPIMATKGQGAVVLNPNSAQSVINYNVRDYNNQITSYPRTIRLKKGFNLIGNPSGNTINLNEIAYFTSNDQGQITIDQAISRNIVLPFQYSFNNQSQAYIQKKIGYMGMGEAVWIYLLKENYSIVFKEK